MFTSQRNEKKKKEFNQISQNNKPLNSLISK